MASHSDPWRAPRAVGPLSATVEVPGSKSASNRALVLAAIADGPSTISGLLDARDTRLMVQALGSLGCSITAVKYSPVGNMDVRIEPAPISGDVHIDVGLAGTVMRFLPPIAALGIGAVTFDGDPHARKRPMATIIDALDQLGVKIEDDAGGRLPFTIFGTGCVSGESVTIDASASSQFVSALLLAGPRFANGLTIIHEGPPVPSTPHIQMTIAMLAEHGIIVDSDGSRVWHVPASTVPALDRSIEPDLSNAAPFLAAAMVAGGTVTVPNWPTQTTQPGDALRGILSDMGAGVTLNAAGLTVSGGTSIRGLDADLGAVGELTPTLAALAALADSPSRFTGIAHLRGHETDRLHALCTEINRLGGNAQELPDGLMIVPTPLHGGLMNTYDDHRMATAGAVLGLAVPEVTVENIDTTAKTLPNFAERWTAMLEVVN